MAIDPISLPAAAGINLGEGDVRHFTQGDSFGVPSMQNPTRQLAYRDALLAKKANELVASVNNKDQIVPLPVPNMTVPPGSSEIVYNFRIPNGYEARVLSAAVKTSPSSEDVLLEIQYNNTFGNTTGDSVVSTSSEYPDTGTVSGTEFSPSGEFLIIVRNTGGVSLDVSASIILTMRPVNTKGALAPATAAVIEGPPGPPGVAGANSTVAGPAGPQGQPGLVFVGDWVSSTVYNINEVVVHDFAGTSGQSSFVALQTHTASTANQPQPSLTPSAFWNFVAEAGESGTGTTGPTGPTGDPGSTTTFEQATVDGTLTTGPDWVDEAIGGGYVAGLTADTSYIVSMQEIFVGTSTGAGMAVLTAGLKLNFKGSAIFTLPKQTYGARIDYDNSHIKAVMAWNGTMPIDVSGSLATGVIFEDNGADGWAFRVDNTSPIRVSALISGAELIV